MGRLIRHDDRLKKYTVVLEADDFPGHDSPLRRNSSRIKKNFVASVFFVLLV
jgi:hypothetical protein